jgi:hypothetical protein
MVLKITYLGLRTRKRMGERENVHATKIFLVWWK